jgi:biofilm PGA synthesis N-glycosyltransferase PgaC
MLQTNEASTEQQHQTPGSVERLPDWPASRYQNKKSLYLSVRTKFSIAITTAFLWAIFSGWMATGWANELAIPLGAPLAWAIIAGIALIPGFMNAFLLVSLGLDKRPTHVQLVRYPGLTILVAAYNEKNTIVETIHSIALQAYPGPLEVIVINDGSKDNTADLVREQLPLHPWLRLIDLEKNIGKANALNAALKDASYSLVATVDADSWLFRNALTNIVERYFQDPLNTRAVAGAVMVRNSRTSWMTRAQEWDYFQGIAAIKRVQSLYQGTMVAQGAFSLYDKATLVKAGGWPDCVGEDIVLSWSFLKMGYRIGHCEDALLFTNAPGTLSQFSKQRQRWSRGMIEAFKQHPGILLQPRLSTTFVYWNLLFPFLDLTFTLVFLPGIVAAMFGYFWIAGPVTLVLIPMAMVMNYFMYRIGQRMYAKLGLKVRFNPSGFFIYTLFYSMIMQPVSLMGYIAELMNLRKTWGTK